MSSALLLLLLLLSASTAVVAVHQDLESIDIQKLEEQWDIEDDMEDDLLHRRPTLPEFKPGEKLTPQQMSQFTGAQHAGKPVMMFVTFESDDRAKNEDLAGQYVSMMKNNHMPVKTYFIEDDQCLLMVDDGKFGNQIVDFLSKQEGVIQITWDQKDLLPEHPKTKAQKEKRERDKKEKEEKLQKLKELHKKKQKKRRRNKKKDEL
eukprot:m.29500 g.29500  ORF g.29500 m.29500 type:complete len:205 (+) comp10535_c0_seq2:100-714(+)